MADFSVNGRMLVGTLKKQFKDAFGSSLRVYKGSRFADEDATLASIRDDEEADTKSGDYAVQGDTLVDDFEKDFFDVFGIKVQVANADDSKLAKNDATLIGAAK